MNWLWRNYFSWTFTTLTYQLQRHISKGVDVVSQKTSHCEQVEKKQKVGGGAYLIHMEELFQTFDWSEIRIFTTVRKLELSARENLVFDSFSIKDKFTATSIRPTPTSQMLKERTLKNWSLDCLLTALSGPVHAEKQTDPNTPFHTVLLTDYSGMTLLRTSHRIVPLKLVSSIVSFSIEPSD